MDRYIAKYRISGLFTFSYFSPLHIKYDNGCGSNENGSNNNKLKDNGSNGNGSNYNGSNDEYIWVANIHRAGAGEPCARREYLVPLTLSEIATMTSEWAEGMFVLCKSCFTEQAPEGRGERERETGRQLTLLPAPLVLVHILRNGGPDIRRLLGQFQ